MINDISAFISAATTFLSWCVLKLRKKSNIPPSEMDRQVPVHSSDVILCHLNQCVRLTVIVSQEKTPKKLPGATADEPCRWLFPKLYNMKSQLLNGSVDLSTCSKCEKKDRIDSTWIFLEFCGHVVCNNCISMYFFFADCPTCDTHYPCPAHSCGQLSKKM